MRYQIHICKNPLIELPDSLSMKSFSILSIFDVCRTGDQKHRGTRFWTSYPQKYHFFHNKQPSIKGLKVLLNDPCNDADSDISLLVNMGYNEGDGIRFFQPAGYHSKSVQWR